MEHNHVLDHLKPYAEILSKQAGTAFDVGVKALHALNAPNGFLNSSTIKVFGVLGLVSACTYVVPAVLHKLTHCEQNLKTKYRAEWALVTGGSSGIGLALVEKLAKQGLNVVIAAYPDTAFKTNLAMVRNKYPLVQFRGVEVDLSQPGYVSVLEEATKDIVCQVLFFNAGYIKTGFFCDLSLKDNVGNHTCNATSAMELTHVFVSKLLARKLPGCVGFTSSPAGLMPCPFSVVYGATKAFLTEFASSIAAELRADGIDVCVVNPSPVASRFYEGTHAIGALNFFKATTTGPETIATVFFQSMGRTVVRDQGYYPFVVRLMLKIVDINLLTDVFCRLAYLMPDFTKFRGVKPLSQRAI